MLATQTTTGLLEQFQEWGVKLIPSGLTLVVVIGILIFLRFALGKSRSSPTKDFRVHAIMLASTAVGVMIVCLAVSHSMGLSEQAMQVIGAIVVGTIGLSSTTILGNALAGLQLRVVRAFKAGDILRVGEHFGRVTERGLFHTEIQTEDRDLTTLPNLFLVSHPYRVVRASGTIISATVSIGYDVPRAKVEASLLQAAEQSELGEPFVQVVELGDFAVTYRIAGLLAKVKQILTSRSKLRMHMLDALHDHGIEIASPTIMTTRGLDPEHRIMPDERGPTPSRRPSAPEKMIFDKAEEAESRATICKLMEETEAALADADEADVAALERRRDALAARLATLESRADDN